MNAKGEKEQPLMLHRALLGSVERFIGVLLEHYAGALPGWLSPEQVRIVTVSFCRHIAGHAIEQHVGPACDTAGGRLVVDFHLAALGVARGGQLLWQREEQQEAARCPDEQPAVAVEACVAIAVVAYGVGLGERLCGGHALAHERALGDGSGEHFGRAFFRGAKGCDVHDEADARAAIIQRDEPEPMLLPAHKPGERAIAPVVALHAFVVREHTKFL